MSTTFLLMVSIVIFSCVIFNRISTKFGIPMLLVFIVLGMLFGSDGIVKIPFDNYVLAEQACTIALIFIMFYGGFGTKWSKAKPIAHKALLLSSIGTVLTAGLIGLFCYLFLDFNILEGLLLGAVISSTDAASVFSILRINKLNLRYNTASMLEIESGSNDPFAYMLTVIILSTMGGNASISTFATTLIEQILFGVAFGVAIAILANKFMNNFDFIVDGFDTIFIFAIAIISYSATTYFGGNGYLSVYLTGLILGNNKLKNKKSLVHFFDAMTGLMQMFLFFLLGLLSFPTELPNVAIAALGIFLFLTFVARPIAVFSILAIFKSKINQGAFVSWSGIRGAASIVFAIMAVTSPETTDNDIFHIVFFIVLLSILFQGTLIPYVAKILNMVDNESDVMKTFTDYIDEIPIESIQFKLNSSHKWIGKSIREIVLPPDSVLALIVRNNEKIIPYGDLVLHSNDLIILVGKAIDSKNEIDLYEKTVLKGDPWINVKLMDIPRNDKLILMVKRGENIIIPRGNTLLLENDILVINDLKNTI
ncbi:MAG: potassium/proton antiporter [Lachnospirales bacterium]